MVIPDDRLQKTKLNGFNRGLEPEKILGETNATGEPGYLM